MDTDYRPPTWKRDTYRALTAAMIAVGFACIGMWWTATAQSTGTKSTAAFIGVLFVAAVMAATHLGAKAQEEQAKHQAYTGQTGISVAQELQQEGYSPQALRNATFVALATAVLENVSRTIRPIERAFKMEDGAVVECGFTSSKEGELANAKTRLKLSQFLDSYLDGNWQFSRDGNQFYATQSSLIPPLALPDIWDVAHTRDEAIRWVDSHQLHLGVGETGPIGMKLPEYPHWFLTGATGGGKSVGMRALLMERLAYGHRVFILDGKGTDYAPFMRYPNVSAVSTNIPEHVALIHKVATLLAARQAKSKQLAKRGDNSWRTSLTPVSFLVDEWAFVKEGLNNTFTPKEVRTIEGEIDGLLRVAREFRIYVMFASQDIRDKTVPRSWIPQFKTIVSYGRPDGVTIRNAFPEQARNDVTILGSSISPKQRGRALVAFTNDEGDVIPALFQSYFSFSPAQALTDVPDAGRANWMMFKQTVVDQIPRLYPREWFKLEYPEPVDGKDPYQKLRDNPGVNMEELSLEDLHRLEPVALETYDEAGQVIPIVEHSIYDPLSDDYVGAVGVVQAGNLGSVIDI